MRPSFVRPIFIFTSVSGRPRWVRKVSSRVSIEAHGAARRAREQAGDDLEVERLGARAEAAAEEGLDDADARLIHLQAARQRKVHVVGHLGHRVQRQPAALGS
jgi:hypothetical protein